MCTAVALETALRACIRKSLDGPCTAIAVSGMAFQQGACDGDCALPPIYTRLLGAIVGDKLQINQSVADGEPLLTTCETNTSTLELLHRCICPDVTGGNTVNASVDLGWDSSCVEPDCGDQSMEELLRLSIVESPDTPARFQVVENALPFDPMDCTTAIWPLETLLRMAAVRLPNGTVAWRIQTEA